jgi:hypothetical protein
MSKIKKTTAVFDMVARALAKEDLIIMRGNYRTASIDMKSRIMRVPDWAELDQDLAECMRGHELSHALHTPSTFNHDLVEYEGMSKKDLKNGLKDCFNIVEDGRIENLLKRKYPGYKKIFIRAYKKMFARGFFGSTDIEEINSYYFHDRLNYLLKCGDQHASKLLHTKEESRLYFDILSMNTFEESYELSIRLYNMIKNEAIDISYDNLGDSKPSGSDDSITIDPSESKKDGEGESSAGEGEGEGDGENIVIGGGDDDDLAPPPIEGDVKKEDVSSGSEGNSPYASSVGSDTASEIDPTKAAPARPKTLVSVTEENIRKSLEKEIDEKTTDAIDPEHEHPPVVIDFEKYDAVFADFDKLLGEFDSLDESFFVSVL